MINYRFLSYYLAIKDLFNCLAVFFFLFHIRIVFKKTLKNIITKNKTAHREIKIDNYLIYFQSIRSRKHSTCSGSFFNDPEVFFFLISFFDACNNQPNIIPKKITIDGKYCELCFFKQDKKYININ